MFAVRHTQRLDGLVSPETSRSKVALASIEPENDFRGAPLFGVRLGAQQTAGSEATRAQSSPDEILERTSSWATCRLLRSKKAECTVSAGVIQMQMIAPGVKHAFLPSDLLSEYVTQVELLGNVIASAGFGLAFVSVNRQIVYENDAAEKLMRTSSELRCEHGCICISDHKASWKLRSLLLAGSRPTVEAVREGSIILRNREGLASLVLHVVPLSAPRVARLPDNERPVAGLIIVNCQQGITDRVAVFANLFDLTPAEARLLAELISGDGLTIAARRLNIARSTARTHLAHILEKTGTHRQAELVRVFFETTIPWSSSVTVLNDEHHKSPDTSSSCHSGGFTPHLLGRCLADSLSRC